jgi:hypothetical protein
MADREACDLEPLLHGTVLLELHPMPGDLAVAVGHRNAPDSRAQVITAIPWRESDGMRDGSLACDLAA